jgi:hypothetical protein
MKTLTFDELYDILANRVIAVIIDDDVLVYPSVWSIDDDDSTFLYLENEAAQWYFNKRDNLLVQADPDTCTVYLVSTKEVGISLKLLGGLKLN